MPRLAMLKWPVMSADSPLLCIQGVLSATIVWGFVGIDCPTCPRSSRMMVYKDKRLIKETTSGANAHYCQARGGAARPDWSGDRAIRAEGAEGRRPEADANPA